MTAAAVAALPSVDEPSDPGSGLNAIRGSVVATPTTKGAGILALRVPLLFVPRALSRIEAPATVSLAPDGIGQRVTGLITLANGGIRAGSADVFAWGLRNNSLGLGSADIRAVGVEALTTSPDGLAIAPADRMLVFALNTWQAWTTPSVNEFDIGINPDSLGVPTYVIGALDHGLVVSGAPDGEEGCFVLRLSDLSITTAAFIKAPNNSSTLQCGVLASSIGVADGSFTYGAAAASLRSPTSVQLPDLARFNPFQPAISQGDHLPLSPGQSGTIALWLDPSLPDDTPALGWMIVVPDNAAGPAQAATIPAVATP